MASPSPTSRARSSPTSFRPTPFSPSRSSAARLRPNTAARPASSSWPPRAPAGHHHAYRQHLRLLWVLRLGERRLRSLLRRQEVGQLRRGRRPQYRPLSRSAGVYRLPRQGQRGELLRPHRLQPYVRRFHPSGPELQPLLVPDAQLLRQPECAERHDSGANSGSSANPTFVQRGQRRSASPRSTPTTSRPPTRTSSATTRSSTWAHFSAGTATAITQARIPLADLGPSNLQTSSISQYRTLTNAGLHADYSYVKGVNNLKIGAQYEQTFLREHDSLGVVDPTYNSPVRGRRRQTRCRDLPIHRSAPALASCPMIRPMEAPSSPFLRPTI